MSALLHVSPEPTGRHAPAADYDRFLQHYYSNPETQRAYRNCRTRFVTAYPDLQWWFAAPLLERVGRRYGAALGVWSHPVTYQARPYLFFLAAHGYATFDWPWLIAIPDIHLQPLFVATGLDRGIADLVQEATQLGYSAGSAHSRLGWILSRICLHGGFRPVEKLSEVDCQEVAAAVRQFGQRADVPLYYGSVARYQKAQAMSLAVAHKLHVLLYHRGQATMEPRVVMPCAAVRPVLKPQMTAVVARYLVVRRLTDRPGTIAGLDMALRHFIAWLAENRPEIESFVAVTREDVLAFAEDLNHQINPQTGRSLAALTKRGRLANLARFFRDVAAWGWEETPGRPLLGAGDLPKMPQRVPRYIPAEELERLMVAIRALVCPYQRAALLIARWSGARRGEIQRLAVDCLDSYPDGTPRLRIPAGKTKQERLVPLNPEAAAAIRALQADRPDARGFRDDLTGTVTHYLFLHYGKPMSTTYLFHSALQIACRAAGLVTPEGKPTITAHRFRHTVGTQLAEKGAKLRTIMHVLGHSSASMSMVYAQISDPEVLKDYEAILGPGATIAGPCAETLRAGGLAARDIDWLHANFFKTELELGHCLRLPQEGPCECDLYLTCAKFVTTPEYAPRLRRRREQELVLIADAMERSWSREAERHRAIVGRIERLLTDLGEGLDGPATEEETCRPEAGA